ncbi:coproporphyrinogen III oxidase family protein [Candidatus Pacearchaeota archaeon]|nr:coproporphyrinogen III oxidase family protein [Candidatus Pacearchaeota archaeon]
MSELIERAREIEKTLDLEKLARAGFINDIRSKAQSHHTVTYPEQEATQLVNSDDIFRNQTQKNLALYFHVPFCTGKCVYCHYVSSPAPPERVKRYLSALEKEIELVSELPGIRDSKVTSAYIGGGTPTYLSPEQLKHLISVIRARFDLQPGAEISVEASPETLLGALGEERLDVIKEYIGRLNTGRLSIGVQTFNDDILAAMKRRHSHSQTLEALENARKRFPNFNIDLMMGLPGQTLGVWENDIQLATLARTPSITTYPLKIKPQVAVWKIFQKHPEQFSDRRDVLLMHIMAIEHFEQDSFLNYKENPVWWFTASHEFVHKHQMHKWGDNGELIGLGVSAYSYVNGWQYYNFSDTGEYMASLERGELRISRGAKLSLQEQTKRAIIFGLKCADIDKQGFARRYGFFPEERFGKNLGRLEKLGLVDTDKHRIRLTYTGRLFSEEVARSFI